MESKQPMTRRGFLAATAATTLGGSVTMTTTQMEIARVEVADDTVKGQKSALTVKVGGNLFLVYNYSPTLAGMYRPYFHPVMGPNDKPITQNGEIPGSLLGHVHHRGICIGHQKVGGVSFWEETEKCGRIVHLGWEQIPSGDEGLIVEQLAWRDTEGRDVLRETRTARIPNAPTENRILDVSLRLRPASGDAVLDATPYNLLACKALNSMSPMKVKQDYAPPFGSLGNFSPMDQGGQITNSEGKANDECRGARARWCDFSGPLGDGTVGGVAILDHPGNLRHPTPWHNWNNMTILASFTYHEPFTLREGQELNLMYRVVVHAGDARKADIEKQWKAFSKVERL